MSRRRQKQQSGWVMVFLFIMLFLAAAYVLFNRQGETAPSAEGSSLQVHFIDVGQADAALVICDGHYMLIDGGNAEDSDLVYSYLERHGAKNLDYMVASHAHEDHIGGLSGALNYAKVDTALCPVTEYSSKVFQNMVKYLEQQGKSLTVPAPGNKFDLGSARVEILGPVQEYDDTNNTSIVLRIDYGETSFLFTGDAEAESEEVVLNDGYLLDSDVLKCGHHGSSSSTSHLFLAEVAPQFAVISCETGNHYGHPHRETLAALDAAGVTVYRTDEDGTVLAESNGNTIAWTTGLESVKGKE